MYINRELGLSFQYFSDYEYFDESYPVAKENWDRRTDNHFGVSFRSPTPCHIEWKHRDFWLWKPAADSVLTLYFGEGVTVQIYKTTMSNSEIAFTEGFQQYLNDTSEAFPDYEADSRSITISDTNWILKGISGMASEAHPLNGIHWKGLRGQSDTRAQLPEQSTTYIAEVFISFLACASQSGGNLVLVFRNDPNDDENVPGTKQPQRLSEAGFYDLVASVKWLKKRR